MRTFKLFITIIIPIIIFLLPPELFDLTILQMRLFAIFSFAILAWVLEPIPITATSIGIITFQLLFLSNKGFIFFTNPAILGDEVQNLISYKDILTYFGEPIIILFLGGFFLAVATKKYRLDVTFAQMIIKPFGTDPKLILLGYMVITAVLSMFMSNTATTAMIFSTVLPVVKMFQPDDKGRIAFTLAIPFAANIGGIGTPIGTPPNAIALKYIDITFAQWMSFSVPFVIVLILITWFLLTKIYPCKMNHLVVSFNNSEQEPLTPKESRERLIVIIVFITTIICWLLTSYLHTSSYVVAIIPIFVFLATGIIDKASLKEIDWMVLWLIAGALSFGGANEATGLGDSLINRIPFTNISLYSIIIIASLLVYFLGSFISHTAATAIILPILVIISNMPSIAQINGLPFIILTATYSASLAMALPVSTPPNAIAYSSGLINTRHLAIMGTLVSSVGLVLTFGMFFILNNSGYLSNILLK